MLHLIGAAGIVGASAAAFESALDGECPSSPDRTAWVAEILKRMLTIEPGMNRNQIRRVFTTEGGLQFAALRCTYVSRDCPFFKVDVTFHRAPGAGGNAGVFEELATDVISTVSRPYCITIAD